MIDYDLSVMDEAALYRECHRLRAAIRKHRDERGDSRCWMDDSELYMSLPESDPGVSALPPREEFLSSCKAFCERFFDNRQRPEERASLPQVSDPAHPYAPCWDPPLEFLYTNYKGELGRRRVIPIRVYHGSTEYHPQDQWLLLAFDLDKQSERTFAVRDMAELR